MGRTSFPLRVAAASLLATTLYFGCVLDREGLLTGTPTGTPSGSTSNGGTGGMAMGGGGTGGMPIGGGGTGGMPIGGGGTGGVLNGGGGTGGGEPLPTDVGGCLLWLRADLGITESTGGVSLWENQCVVGQDASQSDTTRRPTVSANGGPGGTPALDFVRAEFDNMVLNLSDPGSNYTLYAVLDQRSPDTEIQAILTSDDTTGQNRFFALVMAASPTDALGINDGTQYRPCIAAVAGPQWLSWELDATSTTMTCKRSGVEMDTSPWAGVWTWSAAPVLGSFKAGSHPIDALLSEVILYNRVLMPNEQALVEGYLAARYGL